MNQYLIIFFVFLAFCLVFLYIYLRYPIKSENDLNKLMNMPYGYLNDLMKKQMDLYTPKDQKCLPIIIKKLDEIYYRNNLLEITKDELQQMSKYFDKLTMIPKYASFIDYPNKTQKNMYELEDVFGSNYAYLTQKLVEKMGLKQPSPNFFENISRFGALILMVKVHYNRIRPFQASQILEIPFQHLYTKTGVTPALPSGHCLEGLVWGNDLYLQNKDIFDNKPEFLDILIDISTDIGMRRVMAGVHFLTDTHASLLMFQELSKIFGWDNERYLNKINSMLLKKLGMN